MNYKKIIAESWRYTQDNKKLIRWFGVFPAFFTTMLSIGTFTYQFFAFRKSHLFSDSDESFLIEVIGFIADFMKIHLSWTIPAVIVVILFVLFNFLLPSFSTAAAIQIIARHKNNQPASITTGIRYGIKNFLEVLEYNALMKTVSFMFLFVEMAFLMRYSFDLFLLFSPIFALFMIAGMVMSVLFTYAVFYIVIDNDSIFNSMKQSTRLVITNWKHTFLMSILMIVIGIRIVIQIILVFLIPIVIILVIGVLSNIIAPSMSVVIGGVIGAAGLLTASYLNGVVDIFSYTVWTHTFLILTQEKEISARDSGEN